MPRPDTWLCCPRSARPWRIAPRARVGRPDQLTATCPSCGHGLALRITSIGLELVPPRNASPGPGHQLGQASTIDP